MTGTVTVPNDALLPCPFCGATPRLVKVGNEHTRKRAVHIQCSTVGCTISMNVAAITCSHEWCADEAIRKWNNRPQ